MRISKNTLTMMIDTHERADPYSPYGVGKASYEANAERAINRNAKRAEWLKAAAHWRGVMQMRLVMGERNLAFRAYKFARIAVSAAHYV
jgi:hypothetical protein